MRRCCRLFPCAVLAFAAAIPSAADPPRFWCESQEVPFTDSRFVQTLRFDTTYQPGGFTPWPTTDAAEVANAVCDEIITRGLQAGQVAIELVRFGTGAPWNSTESQYAVMFYDPADGWDDTIDTQDQRMLWLTPWRTSGIASGSAWFAEFIETYVFRQSLNSAIPDPTRFIFDAEVAVSSPTSLELADQFDTWQNDSRWNSEPVPGHFDEYGNPLTLKGLYDAAGQPAFNSSLDIRHEDNWPFSTWLVALYRKVHTGCLQEAVYSQVASQWPNCLCSNFDYYSTDGEENSEVPPFIDREHDIFMPYPFDVINFQREWESTSGTVFESQYAPVFYRPFFIRHCDDIYNSACYLEYGECDAIMYPCPPSSPGGYCCDSAQDPRNWTTADRARLRNTILRFSRYGMESIRHSFGGQFAQSVAPWVTIYGSGAQSYASRNLMRDQLAMCRSKGVTEFNVFAPADGLTGSGLHLSRFLRFRDAANDAFAAEMTDAYLDTGTLVTPSSNDLLDTLKTSDWENAVFEPDSNYVADLIVTFNTSWPSSVPARWQVNIEAGVVTGGMVEVDYWNWGTSSWVTIDSKDLDPDGYPGDSPRSIVSVKLNLPTANTIDSNGDVVLRLHMPLIDVELAPLDLVQLVSLGYCPADVNRDGYVNAYDVAFFENVLMQQFDPPGAIDETWYPYDLDCDGYITSADVGLFNTAISAGCGAEYEP